MILFFYTNHEGNWPQYYTEDIFLIPGKKCLVVSLWQIYFGNYISNLVHKYENNLPQYQNNRTI
jgi:hypothetical protein